jgi:hypothetical protein
VALVCALLALPRTARAYRPFDGTDADTAETGKFELELGPAHWYALGNQNYVIAPATVLNFGVFESTELVFDFKDVIAVGALTTGRRVSLLDTDILIKHVLRKGVLQEKSGLSIAAEGGVLTPEVHGVDGFGASLDLIVSYRVGWATVHFNEQAQYSRAHNLDLFSGVIGEGPQQWRVRPVAELFYERELNVAETWSALVGLIWPVKDSFAVDAGVRGALIGNQEALEVRFGLTWSLDVGTAESAAPSSQSAALERH